MLTKTLPSNTAPDTFEGVAVAGVLIQLMSSALFPDCISTFFGRAGGLFKVSWLKNLRMFPPLIWVRIYSCENNRMWSFKSFDSDFEDCPSVFDCLKRVNLLFVIVSTNFCIVSSAFLNSSYFIFPISSMVFTIITTASPIISFVSSWNNSINSSTMKGLPSCYQGVTNFFWKLGKSYSDGILSVCFLLVLFRFQTPWQVLPHLSCIFVSDEISFRPLSTQTFHHPL